MMRMHGVILCFSVYLHFRLLVGALNCEEYLNTNNLHFINDYAKWRNIKSLIFFNRLLTTDCDLNILKAYTNYLSENGLFISFQTSRSFLESIISLTYRKTAVVTFVDNNDEDNNNMTYLLHDEVSKLELYRDNLAWLIITKDEGEIVDRFKFAVLNLNADLVIAIRIIFSRTKDEDKAEEIHFSRNETNYGLSNQTEIFWSSRKILPILGNKNKARQTILNNKAIHIYCNDSNLNLEVSYCLLQLYKIRKELDSSLIINSLGTWNYQFRSSNLTTFLSTEKRVNFYNFPLKFGKRNTTQVSVGSENVIVEDSVNDEKLIEIANYLQQFLNASGEIIYFQKLGHKENDGAWTDILKSVVNEDIDLGLENVIKTPERYYDMAFTHNILTSIRNIYIRPQESNELRDIFLVPFGTRLVACVIATGILFCFMMAFINKISNKINENYAEIGNEGLGEATICCIAIFSMQGSMWIPKTFSGNIILITSLIFALVIYNSYSAFITSVLSVEVTNIGSVDDLLESNYNIGYVKNSEDEIYLRTENDSQLQQIYLRGYLQNPVNNISEGLLKSTKGHYGFFASMNAARKELLIINNYRCNYEIIEIPIYKTKSNIAFPLSRNSPYRKIINLGIMKMYETGVYKYIYSLIVPDLPQCIKKNTFRSAHLPDLTSAFGILILGIQLALIICVGECLWKRRQKMFKVLKKTIITKNRFSNLNSTNVNQNRSRSTHEVNPFLIMNETRK